MQKLMKDLLKKVKRQSDKEFKGHFFSLDG